MERESKKNREIPDRLPHVEEMFSNWFLLFNAFSPISILIDLNESLSKCGSKMRSAQWFYYIKRLIKHRWNSVCVSFAFRIDRIESYGLRGLAFTFLIWMLFKSDKTIVLFVREEKNEFFPFSSEMQIEAICFDFVWQIDFTFLLSNLSNHKMKKKIMVNFDGYQWRYQFPLLDWRQPGLFQLHISLWIYAVRIFHSKITKDTNDKR